MSRLTAAHHGAASHYDFLAFFFDFFAMVSSSESDDRPIGCSREMPMNVI
jgi:hypothetical protein